MGLSALSDAQTCQPDGDVDQSGSVTAADALMVFQQALGIVQLDTCQQGIADVYPQPATPDGNITASDALCIFQKALGLPSCLDSVLPPSEPPIVNAGTDQSVDAGTMVILSGTASDPDGAIVSYLWEQTGGTTVALTGADNATATLTAPDVSMDETLTFRLTVTDDDGAQASDEVQVTVQPVNEPPIVNAGTDQTVDAAAIVTLSGTASDPDGTIVSYLWEQTGGTTVALAGADSATATFTAPALSAQQTLTFRLTVTDDRGAQASDEVQVTVRPANQPPIANAGADQTVDAEDAVLLSGTASDPDGTIVSYLWEQTGSTMVALTGADSATATFTAPALSAQQTLTFRLTVTDDRGAQASDEVRVTVRPANQPPITNAGADRTVDAAAIVTLSGTASDPDGTIVAYLWEQTGGRMVALTGATRATATFTAPDVSVDETLTFRLTVTDDRGAQASDEVQVTVRPVNEPPIANAGADQTVDSGAIVTLSGTASDPDGTIADYLWEQTGGTAVALTGADGATAIFTAPALPAQQTLTFRLTVTDDRGAQASDEVRVTVHRIDRGPQTRAFTGSRGRSLLYRYALQDHWDPEVLQGLLIYFHGHNTATQERILKDWFSWVQDWAYAYDLVPVVVVSPEATPPREDAWLTYFTPWSTRSYSGHGRRFWREAADARLIHELLQSDLDGAFRVDSNRVFFWGGSEGTCFLNHFVQRFGDYYGGGFLGDCGCSEGPDPLWQPPEAFRDRFRVFIKAATGDFLHTLSLQAYGYYKYVMGLDTRGDLDSEGGHCSWGDVYLRDSLEWLIGEIDLPERPLEPHFKRISLMDRIAGVAVDMDGALWAVRQATPQSPATVFLSVDRGHSFEPVSQVFFDVIDLTAAAEALFLTAHAPGRAATSLHRSTDGGRSFQRLDFEGAAFTALRADDNGSLYLLSPDSSGRPDVYVSDDLGDSWTSLGASGLSPQPNYLSPADSAPHLFLGSAERYGSLTVPTLRWVGTTGGDSWTRMSQTPYGPVYSAAWDGTTTWGFSRGRRAPQPFYASADLGQTWEEAELPKAATITFGYYGLPGISALGNGDVLIIGGGYDGFLHDERGAWQHLYGGAAIGLGRNAVSGRGQTSHRVAVDPVRGDVFVSDGHGIFRLDAAFRAGGFGGDVADADGDGIPDLLDVFPANPFEYLDTDADGIGNNEDADDDNDGVRDAADEAPLDAFDWLDTDRDGVGNSSDEDDDGDRVWDVVDAFPLDKREQADSDGDGMGDWLDKDDDGDGVADAEDAFPLYPHEWLDSDRDGIGDNIDPDDDNDGLSDADDPAPRQGEALPHLVHADLAIAQIPRAPLTVALRSEPPAGCICPPGAGATQAYGHLRLGDGPDPDIGFMVDYRNGVNVIYFDRNNNGDLTDDGPPALSSRPGWLWLEVTYASGAVVPYGISYEQIDEGIVEFGGFWVGEVAVSGGPDVLVATMDYDIDGVFTGEADYVCVDADGNRRLACDGPGAPERFRSGDSFLLNGEMVQVIVAVSGHRVEIRNDF